MTPPPGTTDMFRIRQFASDNNSGICPEAMESMRRANESHAVGHRSNIHCPKPPVLSVAQQSTELGMVSQVMNRGARIVAENNHAYI